MCSTFQSSSDKAVKKVNEADNVKTDPRKSKKNNLSKSITDLSQVVLKSFQKVSPKLKSNRIERI